MRQGFGALDDSSPFMAEPTYDPQHGGWMTNEMRVHLKILQTGTVNQVDLHQLEEEHAPKSEEHGFVNDAAIQCTLLGGPLGSDPIEGHDASRHGIHQTSPEIHGQDAVMDEGSYQRSQGSTASPMDSCDLDPSMSSEGGRKEQASSCHLARMSRPISWTQRKWLPFPDDRGDLGC